MILDPSTSTMTDVITKINELSGTNAKADVVNILGSPNVTSDTWVTIETNIQTAKNNLASYLTSKLNQSSTGTETLSALVAKVNNITNRGAVTITPGTTNQTIAAGFHNGSGYVVGDADLVAGNILEGKTIFGVTGTVTAGYGTGQKVPSALLGSTAMSGIWYYPTYNVPGDYVNLSQKIWTAENGCVYFEATVGSETRCLKLNASGGLLWQTAAITHGVGTDSSNNFYAFSGTSLYKYNSSGTLIATYTLSTTPQEQAIDVMPDGTVFYSGSTSISKNVNGVNSTVITLSGNPEQLKVDNSGVIYVLTTQDYLYKIASPYTATSWSYSFSSDAMFLQIDKTQASTPFIMTSDYNGNTHIYNTSGAIVESVGSSDMYSYNTAFCMFGGRAYYTDENDIMYLFDGTARYMNISNSYYQMQFNSDGYVFQVYNLKLYKFLIYQTLL